VVQARAALAKETEALREQFGAVGLDDYERVWGDTAKEIIFVPSQVRVLLY
jgi:hypothetical protein